LVCCGQIAAWDYYSHMERGNQYISASRDASPSPGAC
jgi:hypothetical protein